MTGPIARAMLGALGANAWSDVHGARQVLRPQDCGAAARGSRRRMGTPPRPAKIQNIEVRSRAPHFAPGNPRRTRPRQTSRRRADRVAQRARWIANRTNSAHAHQDIGAAWSVPQLISEAPRRASAI